MSIFLVAPRQASGPRDGQGWNRLSLNAHMAHLRPQCALRPTSWSTLAAARRGSLLADWGHYGQCVLPDRPDCGSCPVLTDPPRVLAAFTDRVLVRLLERHGSTVTWDEPWVMNRPDQGWGERGEKWTWEQIHRLKGWEIGRPHRDQHGPGFWLHRARVPAAGKA
jgi:hypothetical protein